MRVLQKEPEKLQEDRARDREREHMRQQEREEELQILRDRCETWEAERDNGGGGVSVLLSPLLPTLIRLSRPILSSSGNYSLTCKGSWKSLHSFRGAMTG